MVEINDTQNYFQKQQEGTEGTIEKFLETPSKKEETVTKTPIPQQKEKPETEIPSPSSLQRGKVRVGVRIYNIEAWIPNNVTDEKRQEIFKNEALKKDASERKKALDLSVEAQKESPSIFGKTFFPSDKENYPLAAFRRKLEDKHTFLDIAKEYSLPPILGYGAERLWGGAKLMIKNPWGKGAMKGFWRQPVSIPVFAGMEMLGEYLAQRSGLTGQSDTALLLSVLGPMTARGGRFTGKSLRSFSGKTVGFRLAREKLASLQLEDRWRKIANIAAKRGLDAKGDLISKSSLRSQKLYKVLETKYKGIKVDLASSFNKTKKTLDEIKNSIPTEFHGDPEVSTVMGVINTFEEMVNSGKNVDFSAMHNVIKLINAKIRKLDVTDKSGWQSGAAKKIYTAFYQDLPNSKWIDYRGVGQRGMKGLTPSPADLNTARDIKNYLDKANKAFMKEESIQELVSMVMTGKYRRVPPGAKRRTQYIKFQTGDFKKGLKPKYVKEGYQKDILPKEWRVNDFFNDFMDRTDPTKKGTYDELFTQGLGGWNRKGETAVEYHGAVKYLRKIFEHANEMIPPKTEMGGALQQRALMSATLSSLFGGITSWGAGGDFSPGAYAGGALGIVGAFLGARGPEILGKSLEHKQGQRFIAWLMMNPSKEAIQKWNRNTILTERYIRGAVKGEILPFGESRVGLAGADTGVEAKKQQERQLKRFKKPTEMVGKSDAVIPEDWGVEYEITKTGRRPLEGISTMYDPSGRPVAKELPLLDRVNNLFAKKEFKKHFNEKQMKEIKKIIFAPPRKITDPTTEYDVTKTGRIPLSGVSPRFEPRSFYR